MRSALNALVICVFLPFICLAHSDLEWVSDWPKLSIQPLDPVQEQFISERLAKMTLEEKVAQMLMLEHNALSSEDAKKYKIGALLHAAGQAVFYRPVSISIQCRSQQYLSLSCWTELADLYWNALTQAKWNGGGAPIPVLWGTDAMHGAAAIHGVTIFPHNINIGSAVLGNPKALPLYQQMQEATREQVALQGFRQIFSPTVTVGRNTNWGRTYESFSENPEMVYEIVPYGVKGIQTPWMDRSPQRIAATLKHFVGDGGTTTGTGHMTRAIDIGFDLQDPQFLLPRTDRGLNQYSEELLMNLHAPGYFSGIEAGAMSVMVSLSSWDNGALHGDQYLIQEVLKNQIGFDGVVVTDWEGITHVEGCTVEDCPQAVLAGIDMFMIGYSTPNAWKEFYMSTMKHVHLGKIPMSRIDDAVTRILRLKYRLGLFNEPAPHKPSETYLGFGYKTIKQAQNSLDKWASLAKQLAIQSMVLMKNEQNILPLKTINSESPLLVAGRGLNSPTMMVGGWSLYWQGFERQKDPLYNHQDYPQTKTVLQALQAQGIPLCEYQANSENECLTQAKTALVVMGENPYAEWYGDIHVGDAPGGHQSIAYSSIRPEYASDEALVKELKNQGYQVITVFFSGRPLIVEALDHSDAFIAGFLPGSQGGNAVVDLLFGFGGAKFTGKLPFTWPLSLEQGATYHIKPTHFPGNDQAWNQLLLKGRAHEIPVTPGYPYPYGYAYQ